jgi:hypothetical protein
MLQYISIGLAVANLLFVTLAFLPDRIERHSAVPDEPKAAAEVDLEKDPADLTIGSTERDEVAIASPVKPKSSMGETLRSRYVSCTLANTDCRLGFLHSSSL